MLIMEPLSDPQFAPFLKADFDPVVFATKALAETTVVAQIDHLQSGIQVLDGQLRKKVSSRQSDLVEQTLKLRETETALQRISLSVHSLQSIASRVKGEIAQPHAIISAKSNQLRNIQGAVDILRQLNYRMKLTERLRSQVSNGVGILEIAKSAKLLAEIARLDAETDLTGIDCVDEDAKFIKETTSTIYNQAESALRNGLESLSQADVGSSLQVFYNLERLSEVVEFFTREFANTAVKAFKTALDVRKTGAGFVSGNKASDILWERLAEAMDSFKKVAVQMWHLQRVLAKKRDPLKHEVFLDVVISQSSKQLPLHHFWGLVIAGIGDCFTAAYQTPRGGSMRDILVASYPKLSVMLDDIASKIMKEASARDTSPVLDEGQAFALLNVAGDFQEAYLGATGERLQEAVMAAFVGGNRALPTAADLQRAIAKMHEELKASASSAGLAPLAASTVGGALKYAARRAENMASGGPDLRSVTGPINAAQSRNISLCNCLQEVHRSLAGICPRLPQTAADILLEPLRVIEATATDMVLPIFKAEVEQLESTLRKMHTIDWGVAEVDAQVLETSQYIKDAEKQMSRCRVEFLSKFNPPPSSNSQSIIRRLVERLTGRVLGYFVRHAALLRPLGKKGKLQLAKDASELEAAVAANFLSAEGFLTPYKILRSFRRLLFMSPEEFKSSDVPAGIALHLLFSHAPAALLSPHTRKSLTPAQYSVWLDQHTDEEALKFVMGAVEAGQKLAGIDRDFLDTMEDILSSYLQMKKQETVK